jgi:hypothetical protein
MKRIRRYSDFIGEALDPKKYQKMMDDVTSMIENTVRNDDKVKGKSVRDFTEMYLKNPDDFAIDGLVKDDQIYGFWEKYENEIDEILNDIRFFDNSPMDIKAIGTYKYIIACTKKAIQEVVAMIKGE